MDDAASGGLAQQSAQLLKLLMEREPDRGYIPEPTKYLFILDIPGQEEEAQRESLRRRVWYSILLVLVDT